MEKFVREALQKLKAVIDEDKTRKRKEFAESVGIKSEKTLFNWLTQSDSHPIPLMKYAQLCGKVGRLPQDFFPGSPQIHLYPRMTDPTRSEAMLADLEEAIPPGRHKKVVFPLWNSPLQTEALTALYLKKGYYESLFDDESRLTDFKVLRTKRKMLFEKGHYVMLHLLMRAEFEDFVNRRGLFKRLDPQEQEAQLLYIEEVLEEKDPNEQSRLQLRMTKSHFRGHFALFAQPDGVDVLVMSTNTGHIRAISPDLQSFFQHEFSVMWDHGVYQSLTTPEHWRGLFEAAKAHIGKGEEHTRPFTVKGYLKPE